MARLVLYSPLLDLKLLDGRKTYDAESATAADIEGLKREIQKAFVDGLKKSLPVLATLDPYVRQIVSEGLFLRVEEEGTEEPATSGIDDAVNMIAPPPDHDPVCANCRAPATGFQLRMLCLPCSGKGGDGGGEKKSLSSAAA